MKERKKVIKIIEIVKYKKFSKINMKMQSSIFLMAALLAERSTLANALQYKGRGSHEDNGDETSLLQPGNGVYDPDTDSYVTETPASDLGALKSNGNYSLVRDADSGLLTPTSEDPAYGHEAGKAGWATDTPIHVEAYVTLN